MKIVIIGGTGLIGSKLAPLLRSRGHEVLQASPSRGVNAVTGEGLQPALADADIVVDVSNSPSFEDQAVLQFFETGTRNLIAAAKQAGVRHCVALSVVGTDRLESSGYFRAKLAPERLITNSGLAYTILRATQFFEFVGGVADSGRRDGAVHVSSQLMQPMLSDDVAAALADVTLGEPANGMQVAGRSGTLADFRPLASKRAIAAGSWRAPTCRISVRRSHCARWCRTTARGSCRRVSRIGWPGRWRRQR
jgi:uncharacterized protein YbjT (DUF2867 family)